MEDKNKELDSIYYSLVTIDYSLDILSSYLMQEDDGNEALHRITGLVDLISKELKEDLNKLGNITNA